MRFKLDELRADFSQKKKNFLSSEFDKIIGIWLRFINNGSLEEITTKLTFLHLLEEKGIYIHNSPKVIEKTVDKVRATGLLRINNICTPQTIVEIGKLTDFKKGITYLNLSLGRKEKYCFY